MSVSDETPLSRLRDAIMDRYREYTETLGLYQGIRAVNAEIDAAKGQAEEQMCDEWLSANGGDTLPQNSLMDVQRSGDNG